VLVIVSGFVGRLQRVTDFRWHIGFIVLGQYLFCHKNITLHGSQCDDSLSFSKQVRQDAGIGDLYRAGGIGQCKRHRQIGLVTVHAIVYYHAAQPESTTGRRLTGVDLGW